MLTRQGLGGGTGKRGGGQAPAGRDACMHSAGSLPCTAETSTTV